MKKFQLTLIGLCLITFFTACGQDTTQTHSNEPATEQHSTISSIEQETEASTVAESESVTSNALPEIIEAEWYSGKMQINDTIIQLPISITDLMDLGFECKTSDGYVDDYTYHANEKIKISFYQDGVEVFTSSFYNPVESSYTFKEIVSMANPKLYRLEFNSVGSPQLEVYYPGGFKIGDPSALIETRLGTAYETNEDGFSYGDRINDYYFCSLHFTRNRQTQNITNISYFYNALPTDLDINCFETMTFPNIYCRPHDRTYDVTLLAMSNSNYNIFSPGKLAFSFLLDGQVYACEFQISSYTSAQDYPSGEILFSDTNENGIIRTLALDEHSLNYVIQDDRLFFYGRILVYNISQPDDTVYRNETIIHTIAEMVKSMQFTQTS